MPTPELTVATTEHESERSLQVDAFLRQCNRAPNSSFRVIRKHIWQAAGHAGARQFEYWQKGSNKATEVDDRNFRRILRLSPAEFVALLKKMGFYPSSF